MSVSSLEPRPSGSVCGRGSPSWTTSSCEQRGAPAPPHSSGALLCLCGSASPVLLAPHAACAGGGVRPYDRLRYLGCAWCTAGEVVGANPPQYHVGATCGVHVWLAAQCTPYCAQYLWSSIHVSGENSRSSFYGQYPFAAWLPPHLRRPNQSCHCHIFTYTSVKSITSHHIITSLHHHINPWYHCNWVFRYNIIKVFMVIRNKQ